MNSIIISSLIAVTIMLSGCSSSPQTHTSNLGKLDLKNPIYAKMTHGNKGWLFSEFYDYPEEGTINLATGKPTWDINVKSCIAGLGVSDRSDYCDNYLKDGRFLEDSVDKGNAILSLLVAPITFGISATTVEKNIEFNADDYNRAFKEAIAKLDTKTLKDIDTYQTLIRTQTAQVGQDFEQLISDYRNKIKITLEDKSGLSDNFVTNTNPYDWIELKAITDAGYEHQPIKEPDLGYFMASVVLNGSKHLQYLNNKYAWAQIKCTPTNFASQHYVISANCPNKVPVDLLSQKIGGEGKFVVEGRKEQGVQPKYFTTNNADIVITLNNGIVSIENLTSDYLSIEEISFYYRDEITSRTNMSMTLPPESQTKGNSNLTLARDFSINWSKLHFNKLTKSLVDETTLKFGFAIKYQKTGDKSKRLYDTKHYKLKDLI